MSTRDERLKSAFRGIYGRAPAPGFEAVWRRAVSQAREGARGAAWRWALGPALAAVSAAVIAVVVLGPGGDRPPAERVAAKVPAAIADAGAGAEAAVAESSSESGALYVAGTDFLLDLNLPAWN